MYIKTTKAQSLPDYQVHLRARPPATSRSLLFQVMLSACPLRHSSLLVRPAHSPAHCPSYRCTVNLQVSQIRNEYCQVFAVHFNFGHCWYSHPLEPLPEKVSKQFSYEEDTQLSSWWPLHYASPATLPLLDSPMRPQQLEQGALKFRTIFRSFRGQNFYELVLHLPTDQTTREIHCQALYLGGSCLYI